MKETLELQQVVCPSCKQVITSFSPFQAQVECPYCHNKAFNPLITAKKVPIPERLIVFRTSENDFEQAMVDNLVERNYVPTDIFQCINPGNVIKAYLPMFLFEGSYRSSWSCKVGVESTEVRASFSGKKVENKKVKRYLPHTGTSEGNFAFLCLAYEGKDIPEELREFSKQYSYNVMASKDYDPDFLGLDSGESPLTLALDTDADITWNKYGAGLINELASKNALEQLSGEDIKDFRASNSYDLKHNGRYVLAPFWFVYYTYNNEKHYFIMDGLGDNISMSTPINQEEVDFVNTKEKIKTAVRWLWPLTFLVWYFTSFQIAFIFFVVWFIVNFVVKRKMNQSIQQRLESSKAARSAAASKLR